MIFFLNVLLDKLQETFPVNRVVALLSVPVGVAAGLGSAWATDHLPLIADQVGTTELTAVFLSVVAGFVSMAYKWLDGWQLHEDRVESVLPVGRLITGVGGSLAQPLHPEGDYDPEAAAVPELEPEEQPEPADDGDAEGDRF